MIFVYSATITESDEVSSKFSETTAELDNNEDEDTEADIGQYLTLSQLGNILRELSVKSKDNILLTSAINTEQYSQSIIEC